MPLIWGVRAPLARGRIKYFRSQRFEEVVMEAVKDASHLYEVERRAMHAERPGFRINEIQISPSQKVPWHYHNNVQDTFYVLKGRIRIFLQHPKEEVPLEPGQSYAVAAKRSHL